MTLLSNALLYERRIYRWYISVPNGRDQGVRRSSINFPFSESNWSEHDIISDILSLIILTGMPSLRSGLKEPYLLVLGGMMGAGFAFGAFMTVRKLLVDPDVVITHRHSNPYPWLSVPQGKNLKLISAKRQFNEEDKTVKPTFL